MGNVPYSLAILGEVGELGEGTPRKGQKPGIWGKHMQSFGGGRDRTSHFLETIQNVRNVLKRTENNITLNKKFHKHIIISVIYIVAAALMRLSFCLVQIVL